MTVGRSPLVTASIPGFDLSEVINQSGSRVIYRALREADGETVVLKTLLAKYPAKEDIAQLRREFQIAARLRFDGIINVYSLVPYGFSNLAIEMEPFGISLADLLAQRESRSLPLHQFFSIAVPLANILGQLHERNIVHKDIVPRNVLIDPSSEELRLIDFGISSELSRERQDTTLSKRFEGSLPYISPEQTGRMNRDLDYRSDYYSLGVSFFELLTGRLPFSANDALEWVHHHISRPPPTAHSINSAVPESLSQIISKLMSKNAEDRYQSTYGLIVDLEQCRDDLKRAGSSVHFEPGQADVSRRFQIPQRLYGREAELEQLGALFEDVTYGVVGFCLVSGYAGVGKSVLVGELGKSIVRKKGYLIQGKFDQFGQSSAYVAFAHAFRGLMHQLLGEPKERLDSWREALLNALGLNARLIIDLVPELELIIGEQPPVQELPPTEAQNRFQILFLNFVKVFASEEHPLVIFMDDLQWSDVPTLNLIHRLVTTRELNHLFVIGAYRDNAVDASHPLRVTLNEIQKDREVTELPLKPLDRAAVDRLTADTLFSDPERSRPLSELIYQKARGNPFFIIELLKSLHENEAIVFNPEAGQWEWDIAAARRADEGENVVDFMVASQRRLHESTQQVLRLAACIGSTFDLKTLSIIHERSMEQTSAELKEALRRNLVIPLSESYKFVGLDVAGNDESSPAHYEKGSEELNPLYKFQHDRVQQAAYALIDPARRQAVHLSVGRLIQRHSTDEKIEERLIDIVGHLNAGRELIDGASERRKLAGLNLEAGIKASRSSAYASALDFLQIGLELLPDDARENDYDLIWALSWEVQQCSYLTGDHEGADTWTDEMLKMARTPLAKAEALSARTRQYATLGKMRESIQAAYAGLRLLGFDLLDDPDPDAVAAEVAAVERNLEGRSISELIDAPVLTDPKAKVANQLLMEIFPAAFLSGSGDLFPYVVLKFVNISLRYGNSPESAFAYGAYGMLLCGALGDPALGYEYGKLAVAMNERFDDITLKSRIIYVYAMFIHHWSNHWSSMTPWFLKGIEAGYQSGDLLYLAYSAQDCIIWDPKLDLETSSKEQRKYLTIVKECEYQDSLDSGTLFLQMLLNFQGLTDGQYSMTDASFDEAQCVEGMRKRRFMTGIANYHIYKAEIHVLYNDAEGALEHVRAQEGLMASVMSLPQLVRFHIASFLARAAIYPQLEGAEQEWALERLSASHHQMSKWADLCPENFNHLRLLMEAELADLEDRIPEALQLYERAISAATTNSFRRDEAMANEAAAKCLIRNGLPKAAEGYLQAARYLFYRLGARRKVEDMERTHPQFKTIPPATAAYAIDAQTLGTQSGFFHTDSLDLSSVLKASQAISGELVLAQLWKTTMQILLENAGGQSGYLVERENDQLMIRALGEADGDGSVQAAPIPVESADSVLPVSVVNNALRTSTPIVLSNATQSNRFATDPYIVKHQPMSVICIPLPRHGQWKAAVYMENNLTAGAFTEERVEIIKLLAAQASISMENARLYEEQTRLIEAQQRFVPSQFLQFLGHEDIARVNLGEHVAREMSVMFADLREFTPLAERLGPQQVIELLNRYFSHLSVPIAEANGFIDSYNGDEIMALFGLPAHLAVEAGTKMCRALEEFNTDSLARGGPELRMGIGVNTGPLVLGTVGGQDRMKCGVVGDTVNLASRVEQLTKVYHAPFLIGERTFRCLQEPAAFSIRMVDRVAVKGRAQAIELYEVLDAETPERRAAKEATKDRLELAMERYFDCDFAAAHDICNKALAQNPEDAVLSMFAKRSKRYLDEAPPEDWQCFETLTKK